MKAAIFHGPMNVSTETVDRPTIKPTDILIKVRSCCICGSDLHMYMLGLFTDFICRNSEGGSASPPSVSSRCSFAWQLEQSVLASR